MSSKVFFCAEAGKNFIDHQWQEGAFPIIYYLNNARKLAIMAKGAGADAVKFQTHVFADEKHIRDESRHVWIQFNESITPFTEFWTPLKAYCDEIGIEFMSTPMSQQAAIKINPFVGRWKVGSGSVTDIDLLEYLSETGKPVILSTGMSTQSQVEHALTVLKNDEITLLYCKSIYPCPIDKIDLRDMWWIEDHFKLPVGFSDHTLEITTPMEAALEGAKVIEKHFTLDKNAVGPDHKISLEPDELRLAIMLVREYEDIKDVVITPDEEEIKFWKTFRL